MKVAIFGGAFDPITKSHLRIVDYILESDLVDKVWLMPCYISYHDKSMTPPQDRLSMCELAVKSLPKSKANRIKVSDFEIKGKLTGESYDIILNLLKTYPDKQFYFVIGMDNANTIYKWTNWDKLINMMPFIVVPRGGYDLDNKFMWYTKDPHIYLKNVAPDNGSSTKARSELRTSGYTTHVRKDVINYIKEKGLFKRELN